jgi:hypothetical protein
MSHTANRRQMTFEGEKLDELLNFIDEKFGDKGCLLLDFKKIGVWNYEKNTVLNMNYTSCTIVYFRTEPETCEVYLWGSGGQSFLGADWGSQDKVRDFVAKEISKYAVEELKLRKTLDTSEDL